MGNVTQSRRQLAWVFDLNKCIGCQTCSVACKVLWPEEDPGTESMWWMTVNTQPGRGMLARDGGGVLLTQAIHTLDVMLDLAGPVQRVSAFCRTSPMRSIDSEDIACAAVSFRNGALGVVDATTTAYPGYPERIEFAGTRGSAVWEAERLIVQRQGEAPLHIDGSTAGGGGADPMAFSHEWHRRLIEDFLDAVRTGREPQVSGRSALAVHALIDAMLASARAGAQVQVAVPHQEFHAMRLGRDRIAFGRSDDLGASDRHLIPTDASLIGPDRPRH